MALQKQNQVFNFGRGVARKDSVDLIPVGKFFSLNNTIFDVLGQLTKRNGFGQLTSTLGSVSFLTTFENNLIGLGQTIQAYSAGLGSFVNKGQFPQVQVSVTPINNVYFGINYADLAIATNGIMCQVNTYPITTSPASWTILEQATGQILAGPTPIVSSGGASQYAPKVFAVGSQFTIVYDAQAPLDVSSAGFIEYVTIPVAGPFVQSGPFIISSACSLLNSKSFDGVVMSTSGLFLSWVAGPNSNHINSSLINPINNTASPVLNTDALGLPIGVSVCKDSTVASSTVWIARWNAPIGSQTGVYKITATNALASNIQASNFVTASGSIAINSNSFSINNIAMTAQNGSVTAYIEVNNSFKYNDLAKTNLLFKTSMGVTGSGSSALTTPSVVARGLGLASKGFIFNSTSYVTGLYTTTLPTDYQPTYFVINSTGQVQAKVAYGNASQGYYNSGLPTASVVGSSCYLPYLVQDTVQSVGKGTSSTQVAGLFAFLGVNLLGLNFMSPISPTKEIGKNLLIGGGFLGAYDGQQFTENDFFLYPDAVTVTPGANPPGGGLAPQDYFYSSTYQWTDNKGNIFRSAPSIPVKVTNASGSSVNTVSIPSLRLSYKNWPYGGINTPVQINVYRWSTNQQIYYQDVSLIQDTVILGSNADYATLISSAPDSSLAGNVILYTNGGIVEDVGGPPTKAMTTFDSRLWLIDSEDQNLLWFSKQVIEGTPVEMSDLFTFYVAPNVGAEGPTGVMNCLAPMDDKLIIFKESAIYYINGAGPDNTGAQNQYSQPIFVTSGVGCSNQNSIVLIPNGLMFQSNKGIWLLGRDLSTTYIGKDVEAIANTNVVQSAITIPGTNQVRFTMNTGITLLYDYFVNEWGTFSGQPGISSCLYNNLHTYVSASSSLYQETPSVYQDGANPVLMSFTTGWIGLAGLQGYQRAYAAYLLGTYYSPHNFTLGIGYDYNSAITQTITVNPTNVTGSGSTVEQWEMNFIKQQCQSFQLTFTEVASQSAGQGLTISGLDLLYGVKKGYPNNMDKRNSTS
jgi:hypothetical protein